MGGIKLSKRFTYNSFLMMPVKVRNSLVSEVLTNKWGYSIDPNDNKHDKAFKKALTAFQKSNGLAGNAVVCEKTFNLLQLSSYMKSR